MKMTRENIEIEEIGDAWRITREGAIVECAPTAADALRTVEAIAHDLCEIDVSSVFIVTWTPLTVIGRQVVRAITS